MLVCVSLSFLHARPRVQRAPGLPCALCFREARNEPAKPRAKPAAGRRTCARFLSRPILRDAASRPLLRMRSCLWVEVLSCPFARSQTLMVRRRIAPSRTMRPGTANAVRSAVGSRARLRRDNGRPQAYTSTTALSELSWMNSRRGSTMSPISLVKMSSASSTSLIFTCSIVRSLVSSVVCQSCSGFISPRPL